METISLPKVPKNFRDGRAIHPANYRQREKRDHRLARELAQALRHYMPRMGPRRVSPHTDEVWTMNEREAQRAMGVELPIHSSAMFRVGGDWFSYQRARPLIRQALELSGHPGRRSEPAVALAKVLRGHMLDDAALVRARPKLIWVYARLRPLN